MQEEQKGACSTISASHPLLLIFDQSESVNLLLHRSHLSWTRSCSRSLDTLDPDPHDPGSQRSRVSRDLEQDRSQLKCDRCNNRLTDSDWSKIKSKGWDAEIVEHAPFCSSCIDQIKIENYKNWKKDLYSNEKVVLRWNSVEKWFSKVDIFKMRN